MIIQHLQPNTTLQGGKYRKLRVSEWHKNLFLDVRAEAGYSIERMLGGVMLAIKKSHKSTANLKKSSIFAT